MVRKTHVNDKFIALSGGFDPIHKGHLRMINDAAKFGKVIILLNSDEWLRRKKGYLMFDFEHRKEILENVSNVYCVLQASDSDNTVCKSIEELAEAGLINYFGNGGDRKKDNTPEDEACRYNHVQTIYGLGGDKIASSSELMNKAIASGA